MAGSESASPSRTLRFEIGELDRLAGLELLSEPLFLVRSLSYPDSSVDKFNVFSAATSVLAAALGGIALPVAGAEAIVLSGLSSLRTFFFFLSCVTACV